MGLESLRPQAGSRKKKFRVGRGPGSGNGKTAGAGNKGQLSRAGFVHQRGFEGGQMPLHRRVPKRGFRNLFKKRFVVVNLDQLGLFKGEITPESLVLTGVIHSADEGVVVLGRGDAPAGLKVKAHRFSAEARRKIEAAGGSVEILAR
ncbi:MAG TPA: 50S ribosomal protein L15 [Candidatus Polarisedimenticolia bacterium]|nr:50S ribosomal protein L15 [Candidatus Polarisedimenticolia bacterium]